ncbi:MAG: hypothetical protein ACK54L_02435, partial [Betaproteobacteria bacterium]
SGSGAGAEGISHGIFLVGWDKLGSVSREPDGDLAICVPFAQWILAVPRLAPAPRIGNHKTVRTH